jgi:hypothetical protein
MIIQLDKSDRKDKKWRVIIDGKTKNKKTIHFGSKGMEDYTIHNDDLRKLRYTNRHKKRENWNKSGIKTAGFWSKHLLWNKKTIRDSIKDIENKYNVDILYR